MKTKRQLGIFLEEQVVSRLKEIEPNCRRTKGSGCATELGDILSKHILCECKNRSTESITIHENVWNKLLLELPVNSDKLPVYILANKNNKKWALLDMDDFFDLLKKAKENED
jgi:Holliday junction resolvase